MFSGFPYQLVKTSHKTSGRGEGGALQDDVEMMQNVGVPMVQRVMRRIWCVLSSIYYRVGYCCRVVKGFALIHTVFVVV